MTDLQRVLTKFFIDKCTKSAMKRKAKIDESGNLVLKESKITILLSIILFIMMLLFMALAILIDMDIEERDTILIFGGVFIIPFIVLFIHLGVSKKIITQDSVISCGLLGKKHMKFTLIDSVQYKSSGNRLILKGNGKKMMIPIMLDGFNDFFEILQKKVGEEKCRVAKVEIDALMLK